MIKVFLSQPMNGKTDEDIAIERNIAIKEIRNMHKDEKVWILDTFISEAYDEKHPGLKYLAESIRMLDEADEIWMLPGWENARGCRIERACAEAYGIPVKEY